MAVMLGMLLLVLLWVPAPNTEIHCTGFAAAHRLSLVASLGKVCSTLLIKSHW